MPHSQFTRPRGGFCRQRKLYPEFRIHSPHCPTLETHNRHVELQRLSFGPGPTKYYEPTLSSPCFKSSAFPSCIHELSAPPSPAFSPLLSQSILFPKFPLHSSQPKDSKSADHVRLHQLRPPNQQHPPLPHRPRHLRPRRLLLLHPHRPHHDGPPILFRIRPRIPHLSHLHQ